MRTFAVAAMVCALATLSACNKRQAQLSREKPRAKLDACKLLSAQDVQEVQKAPLKDTKGNENTNGKILISQCYYATDPPHQSISLSTMQSDPASGDADAARDYWHQIAVQPAKGKDTEEEREKRESLKEHERGEEDEAPPLKKIDGVGDEAYWAGSRVGGALYVFQKDVIVRVSVGGPDTEQAKIDKSKKVAAKALARLP